MRSTPSTSSRSSRSSSRRSAGSNSTGARVTRSAVDTDRDRRYVPEDDRLGALAPRPRAPGRSGAQPAGRLQATARVADGGWPRDRSRQRGDISPLRKKWPRFARFLHLAKREHGQRFASLPWNDHDRAKLAAIMAGEITALWQKHYDGKKVRRFPPSAVEIAAERWDVKVADVERWVRRLKKEAKKR